MRTISAITAFVIFSVVNTANAVVIEIADAPDPTVNGQWAVSTITGDFAALQTTLEAQAWWTGDPVDDTLAVIFATALGDALTVDTPSDVDRGPRFAFFFGALQVGSASKFLGGGVVTDFPPDAETTYAIAERILDIDQDGVPDADDNCSTAANADQRDSDNDGFGNDCDADLNNDCVTNVIDLGILRSRFFTNDADADFNGDGIVNIVDLGRMRAAFFAEPGPSSISTLCD